MNVDDEYYSDQTFDFQNLMLTLLVIDHKELSITVKVSGIEMRKCCNNMWRRCNRKCDII